MTSPRPTGRFFPFFRRQCRKPIWMNVCYSACQHVDADHLNRIDAARRQSRHEGGFDNASHLRLKNAWSKTRCATRPCCLLPALGYLADAVGFQQLFQINNLPLQLFTGIGVSHERALLHALYHPTRRVDVLLVDHGGAG